MFKPESWQSHNKYRTIVNTFGRSLSRNNPRYHFDLYSKEQQKLLALNLDPVRDYIAQFYSGTGRPAKNQVQILRSLILFVLLFNKTPARTSLTSWVRDVLPNSISLAVLPSMDHGLISPDGLTLSGDGTAVISHSSPYGKHLSSCSISCPYRHDCDRHYSDPNAGWGWDSDNL